MNVVSKLVLSGLALAGVFGVSTAVGAAVGPIDTGSATHTVHDETAGDGGSSVQSSSAVAASVTPTDLVDGYAVTRTGGESASGTWTFDFTVTLDGRAVTTDSSLGEPGHLVVIRESDYAYLHVHPLPRSGDGVSFVTSLPSPGTYRLFFDFSAGRSVHTAAFVFDATGSQLPAAVGVSATTDEHAGH